MPRTHSRSKKTLAEQYPPSEPCGCEVCLGYCVRPGWWTVEEAGRAMEQGYGPRMMLEIAPEQTFGVLSPAFKGNEGGVALQQFASKGCGFLKGRLCELHGTGVQPLECRFCHHDRPGMGPVCHAAVEQDWYTADGRELVKRWLRRTGVWDKLGMYGLAWLKK